jgi:hypothetical protein
LTTIAEGLSAISTALGIVKTLREIDKGVQEAEFKLKIASVTEALADAKLALVEAQDEVKRHETEASKLRDAVRFRAEDTILSEGFLFRKVDGKPMGKPFCSVCSDEGRFIHLNRLMTKDGETFQCPRCKANFGWYVPQHEEAV